MLDTVQNSKIVLSKRYSQVKKNLQQNYTEVGNSPGTFYPVIQENINTLSIQVYYYKLSICIYISIFQKNRKFAWNPTSILIFLKKNRSYLRRAWLQRRG